MSNVLKSTLVDLSTRRLRVLSKQETNQEIPRRDFLVLKMNKKIKPPSLEAFKYCEKNVVYSFAIHLFSCFHRIPVSVFTQKMYMPVLGTYLFALSIPNTFATCSEYTVRPFIS